MKKITLILLIVALTLSIASACAPTAPSQVKPIELKWAHHDPPTGWNNVHLQVPWSEKMMKASGGKIHITMYPAQMLCKINETYDAVKSGATDFGWDLTGVFPGQFPLTEIMTLPFMPIPSAEVGGRVMWELYEKFPEIKAEYPGVKVLAVHTCDPYFIMTIKKPITKLEDLKGMKIRVPGGIPSEMMKALGAIPVSIPMSELYLSLQKGIADGTATPYEPIIGQKLGEVCKYATFGLHLYVSTFWLLANENSWNSLPKSVQDAIWKESCGRTGSEFAGREGWDTVEGPAMDELKKYKVEINTVSKEEEQRWREATKDIAGKYISGMEAKGKPAQKIYDEATSLLKKYGK